MWKYGTVFCILYLTTVANGATINKQDSSCELADLRSMIASSIQIRSSNITCGNNTSAQAVSINEKCKYMYQCPLDRAQFARHETVGCMSAGFWDYNEPTCQDNIKMLQDLEIAILFGVEDKRPVPVYFQPQQLAHLKSMFMRIEIAPVKEEEKSAPKIDKGRKDEDSDAGSGDEEPVSTATAVNHALTTTTTPVTTEKPSGPKKTLKSICMKNQMCRWVNTHGSCNFLDYAPVYKKLCSLCVRFICKKCSIVIFGGSRDGC